MHVQEGHTREGKRWSHGAARGALRKRPPQNAPSMLAGAMHAVMMSVVSVAAAPMVALSGGPRRNIGMSHLPADIEVHPPPPPPLPMAYVTLHTITFCVQ